MLNAKITFYTMLANLIAAGVPLDRALTKGIPSKLRNPCQQLRTRLQEGLTLSQAMAEQKRLFTNLELALVMVGESTGTLDKSAASLRDNLTRTKQLRAQALTSLAYPIFTYVVAIPLLTVAELATSQVGTGGLSMDGWGTAIATRCLLGWGIPLLLLLVCKFFLPGLFRSAFFGAIINAIPFFGGLQHSYNASVFWNTFGTCIQAGLTYPKAIRLAANACPGNYHARRARSIAQRMERDNLAFSEAFDHIASRRDERFQASALLSTGEATGRLDEAAFHLATITEEATRTSLKRFTAIFPMVVYLILAGYLAFKIIGFYASYFNKILSL